MIESGLYDLVHEGEEEKVREWLDRKPEDINAPVGDGYAPLHVACIFGREALVHFLLDRRALVNLNAMNASRTTPLHLAVGYRGERIARRMARVLIENGAELNGRQAGGQTPLHHAVARGSVDIVRTLVASGADPFLKDDNDLSPMDLARGLNVSEVPVEEIQNALREAFSLET